MSFYSISTKLRDHLKANTDVNTVTMGNFNQLNLKKQSIFNLVHIEPQDCTLKESTMEFTFAISSIGIVDFNKNSVKDLIPAIFRGNNDLHDVYNTTLEVLNDLYLQCKKGSLFDDDVMVEGNPNCEPFNERFDNGLTGWTMILTFTVPQSHAIC